MRVRRSPHLITYWRRGTLVATNYATRDTCPVTPFVCQVLDACDTWKTPGRIGRLLGVAVDVPLAALFERLIAVNFLERAGDPPDPRRRAMAALDPWNPEAGFFHTSTKDVRFATARQATRQAKQRAAESPMPPIVKRYPRATPRIALAKPRADGEFPRVLLARRTSRRFSTRPISSADLSTLLGLTSGVQQWVTSGRHELALKTSPSGGARHGIETYVVVRAVAGLPPAVYHYAPDRHALERIRRKVPLQRMRDYLPNSGYFADASAMVFFTAMFERILWRYPYSRAYRAALVEAGHLCQTFCLTATWLGLAPYCVMGLADSLIERDLGIDGIRESVLYCAGVGRPPGRLSHASLTRGTLPTRKNPKL